MEEIWKDIVGYEGLYQVSDFGNVKSLNFNKTKKEKLHKPFLSNGYLRVIFSKNNVQKKFTIHRLSATAFIENPLNLPQVNHKDGIKTNNYRNNLEWCTQSENTKHAHKLGLINQNGTRNHNSKLTEFQVLEIRESKLSSIKLAKKYNVCFQSISDIKLRKIWKHI